MSYTIEEVDRDGWHYVYAVFPNGTVVLDKSYPIGHPELARGVFTGTVMETK